MDCLDNYDIEFLEKEEIEIYTKKLVESFKVDEHYKLYLEDNKYNYAKGHKFLIAKTISENLIIGGICLEGKPMYRHEIFIEHLFVDSKYRNQGVATSLLEYIADNKNDIFKNNKIELYLFCEEYLKEFYEKKKFIETDTFVFSDKQKVLRMDKNI